MKKFEYATVEWLWDSGDLKINFGNFIEEKETGSYSELVNLLNRLGEVGWEVVSSATNANWVYWTLKREIN